MRVTSNMWMSHFTYMNESCHTCGWVVSSPPCVTTVDILHSTATHGNTVQHTATHCYTLKHTATHCNTPQHTATHYNTLGCWQTARSQQTATSINKHCNTLQQSAGRRCYHDCMRHWVYAWLILCVIDMCFMNHLLCHAILYVTHVTDSCHTYKWLIHVTHLNGWFMAHMWMNQSHVSHTWKNHVTSINVSCHTWDWVLNVHVNTEININTCKWTHRGISKQIDINDVHICVQCK